MKKVLSLFFAALMLTCMLVGCSDSGSQSSDAASSEETKASSEVSEDKSGAEGEKESETSKEEGTPPAQETGKVMSKGPKGEEAASAEDLKLTDDEIAKIKEGKYKVAICFHYSGDDWSRAQQIGLKDTFESMGMEVVSVTDANFKVEQQVTDIENAMALNPDVIVSIPVDPVSTASAYKKAAEAGIKLVFMDNCPEGMEAGKDYVSVVSADNYGNGVAAARIMGEQLGGKGKIGVVYHDANFFVTNQRVEAFEKTIADEFPDIEIIDRGGFDDANKVSEIADTMLTKNPDIDGIFGNWDIPAEGIVSSAVAAGRNDLVVTTIDLGDNVARMIAEGGIVKGLGAQLPYDQGVAEAKLAAYALLGKETPAYVAVPAQPVTRDNVLEAYKTVYHQDPPDWLKEAYEKGNG